MRSTIYERADAPQMVLDVRVTKTVSSLNTFKPNFQLQRSRIGHAIYARNVQKEKDEWKEQFLAACAVGSFRRPRCRCRITVVNFRNSPRFYDDENYRGGLKMPVDVLKNLGVIRDDSPTWLEHGDHKQRSVKGEPQLVHSHWIIEYGVPPHDTIEATVLPPFEPGVRAVLGEIL